MILPKQVAKSNCENELCMKICKYLANLKNREQPDTFFKDLKVDNKLFQKRNKLWSTQGKLAQNDQKIHNQSAIDYPKVAKTMKMTQ